MGRPAKVSFEQVAHHANALRQQGEDPSASAIRERLGEGSYTTIQRHLMRWRGKPTGTEQRKPIDLPPALIVEISNLAHEHAARAVSQVAARCARLSDEIEALLAEGEARSRQLDSAMRDNERLKSKSVYRAARAREIANELQIERDKAEHWRVQAHQSEVALQRCDERLQVMEAALRERESAWAAARAELEAERIKNAELLGRLEQVNAALSEGRAVPASPASPSGG